MNYVTKDETGEYTIKFECVPPIILKKDNKIDGTKEHLMILHQLQEINQRLTNLEQNKNNTTNTNTNNNYVQFTQGEPSNIQPNQCYIYNDPTKGLRCVWSNSDGSIINKMSF